MSSLTATDKKYLEALLDMGGGYVLDFSDPTFSEFFSGFKIDIHSTKYQTYGQSKAKKLRAFWEQEEDKLVGRVLSDMIDAHRVDCELNDKPIKQSVMDQCTAIVGRLTGSAPTPDVDTEGAFLEQEFGKVSFDRMPIEDGIKPILEARLREASKAMKAGAWLSVIIMCGSILEGALLGVALGDPKKFNKCSSSPKDKDKKVLPLLDWKLVDLINVAHSLELIKLDVKKFSHELRDFRNYVHAWQQKSSGFTPRKHTAEICLQVLKAALADLSGSRA